MTIPFLFHRRRGFAIFYRWYLFVKAKQFYARKRVEMKYLRIKKQADFNRLFQKGKRAFSSSLTVLYAPAKEMRMGISVGKKHGKSVQRNRIKRLLREAFRATSSEMKGTYSFILIPKVSEEYSYHTYKNHLQCMIKKEKL